MVTFRHTPALVNSVPRKPLAIGDRGHAIHFGVLRVADLLAG
jgi:hypothetical protein